MKTSRLTVVLLLCLASLLALSLISCFGETEPAPTHTHTWSAEWEHNESRHWHPATCEHTDLRGDEEFHTYSDHVCTVCGFVEPERLSIGGTTTKIVHGIGTCRSGDIVIPAEYDGVPVTGIGSNAFLDCEQLTSIVIPDSVTEISSQAFNGCVNLRSVTIGNGVTRIGMAAFAGCTALTEVNIPKGVTQLDNGVFGRCTALETIVIPEGVTELDGTFSGCSALTSVTLPDSIRIINSTAFRGCAALPYTTWNNGVYLGNENNPHFVLLSYVSKDQRSFVCHQDVKVIAGGAFSNYEGLTSIELPSGISYIASETFSKCAALESVTIPAGVTGIGASAFDWCYSLKTVEIPDGVTEIGQGVFSGCDNLESVVIPDSVLHVGEDMFVFAAEALQRICTERNGAYYIGNPNNRFLVLIRADKEIRELHMEEGTKVIADHAFEACEFLEKVHMPDSVVTAGELAFSNCIALTEVRISRSVTTISGLFYNCAALSAVFIPDSVTSISYNAFSGCKSLASVTFENTNGWFVGSIPMDVSDPAKAAEQLKDRDTAASLTRKTGET